MKHLKKFNESNISDVQELCNDVLAEMNDKDYNINVEDMKNGFTLIEITRKGYQFFTWATVKDHIIFLVNHMKDDYTFVGDGIDVFITNYGNMSFTVAQVISDDFKLEREIMSISIEVK